MAHKHKEQKKNKIWIALGIAGLLLVILIFGSRKEVSISKVTWQCAGNQCVAEFTIENRTGNYLPIKISLRAHKQERVSGSQAVLTKIVGEQILDDELKPKEIRKFKESLTVSSRRIHRVAVNAWAAGD